MRLVVLPVWGKILHGVLCTVWRAQDNFSVPQGKRGKRQKKFSGQISRPDENFTREPVKHNPTMPLSKWAIRSFGKRVHFANSLWLDSYSLPSYDHVSVYLNVSSGCYRIIYFGACTCKTLPHGVCYRNSRGISSFLTYVTARVTFKLENTFRVVP